MKQDKIREIYNRTARQYEELVTPCKTSQYMLLIHELKLMGSEQVLELGSGTGQLSIEIAKRLRDGRVIGLDISEEMVKLASRKAKESGLNNLDFRVGDISNLHVEDETFDICVNSYLIHWIRDIPLFLQNIRRVLKDGGRLGIISPSTEWYGEIRQAYRKVMENYRGYLPEHALIEPIGIKICMEEELHNLLRATGFRIEKSIAFRFREAISIEECFRRVSAKSGEEYLSFLPDDISDRVKHELYEEIMREASNLNTTESGYIIVATRSD